MIFQYSYNDPFLDYYLSLLPFLIVLSVIQCIIGIILSIWVYKDAQSRDMDAKMWCILVILFGCVGCLIYLLLREKE